MQMYIQLVYFLSPVVDISLFPEIMALFLLSLIAISLYPLLSNPSSKALANLNLLVLSLLNSIYVFSRLPNAGENLSYLPNLV